jgi:CRP-like cAMP-binding protein/small-conductance mechanosensitive channel
MRYAEIRLLVIPILLFLIFFGVEYHQTRWYYLMSEEAHYALQTLTWLSGGWLVMRLTRVFFWQRRQKRLAGAAPPMLLQHTFNLIVLSLAVAGIAHAVFGQPLTGFWATSSVVGIVLGIALRSLIADFFSGIAMEFDPPYKIGDYIELRMSGEPLIGRVTEVTWRATHVVPRDSTNTVYVPNSVMSSIAVNNVYQPLGKTRFELFLSFPADIPHDRVRRLLTSAAHTAGVADALLETVAKGYNASGVEWIVRYWLTPEKSPTGARNRLMAAIMDLTARSDLRVAFPHEEVVLDRKVQPPTDGLEIKTAFLRRNPFFRSCLPEELKTIATHMHTRRYPPGTRIFNMGDEGDSMFLISEGLIEVSLPNGSAHGPLVVGKLLAGDFFGEMAMLTGVPRVATVTSVTDSVLYEVRRQHIEELMRNRPEIADGMTHVAAERQLRNQNAELAADSDVPSEAHRNLKSMILGKLHSLFALMRD